MIMDEVDNTALISHRYLTEGLLSSLSGKNNSSVIISQNHQGKAYRVISLASIKT
jgi:hypothetical protein